MKQPFPWPWGRAGLRLSEWASVLRLDVLDRQIQTIRSVINPDKLGHLGPVAHAWAIDHEVKQARRQMN